jgi:spermidine synthase
MQQSFFQIIIPLLLIIPSLLLLHQVGIWQLKKYKSSLLGEIKIYLKFKNKEKILAINNYDQGISVENNQVELSYFYRIASLAAKHCQGRKNPQALMLGLGANTVSNLIARLNPQIHQTLVEFDPQIVQACRDYFDLDKLSNYDLMIADVYELIKNPQAFAKKFDVLIVDVFTGKPPYVSLESNQPNFIKQLLPWLKKDGMIIFNRPGNTAPARSDSLKLKKYLATLFKNCKLFDIQDPVRRYRNNVIAAWVKLRS